jgi:3-hydroxyacyl-CoA dehydrogenase
MSEPVRVEWRAEVALVVIDNPPVNATSQEVRSGLLAAVTRLAGDPACRAIVFAGAGRNFVAGADIREFGRPLRPPEAPEVIQAIEAAPQPVIAAICGAALGGGLELALGCDRRLAAADAVLGLPEITLGFIPGNGGTQRLPRLCGLPAAIELVTSGRRIDAEEALALGIVDAIAPGDVIEAAVAEAAAGRIAKRRVRDMPVPAATAAAIAVAEAEARKKCGTMPWIDEALAVLALAGTSPVDEALARERAVFQALRVSEPALALRHLFFAERAAGRLDGSSARPRQLEHVAVVGGGLMGSGIAYALLTAGLEVTLIERDEPSLEAACGRLKSLVARAVAGGRLPGAAGDAALAGLVGAATLDAAAPAHLVIEAVVEDLEVKETVFAALGRLTPPGTILASNTSYLDIEALARASGRPADVCGLHFFSPAHVQKLLEVVRAEATAEEVLATVLALARRMGKVPVVARAAPGFIGNAIYGDYRSTVEFLLEDGAAPEAVDAALEAFGFAMGPFRVFDLAGLDIAWRVRQAKGPPPPDIRTSRLADRLCEAGRFGQKTGAGWYRYADGNRQPIPDPEVAKLIERTAAEAGIERRPVAADAIVGQAIAAMLNRAALLVEAGIAARPGDIDVVMANGYGFPRAKGGPVFWASRQDRPAILAAVAAHQRRMGAAFPRGDVAVLLDAVASAA